MRATVSDVTSHARHCQFDRETVLRRQCMFCPGPYHDLAYYLLLPVSQTVSDSCFSCVWHYTSTHPSPQNGSVVGTTRSIVCRQASKTVLHFFHKMKDLQGNLTLIDPDSNPYVSHCFKGPNPTAIEQHKSLALSRSHSLPLKMLCLIPLHAFC